MSSGWPAVTVGTDAVDVMAGMPPAGPSAMAVPTAVTEPGVQCSAIACATRRHVAEREVRRPAVELAVVHEGRNREVLGHVHQRDVR